MGRRQAVWGKQVRRHTWRGRVRKRVVDAV